MSDNNFRTTSLISEQMEDNSLLTIWTKTMGLIVRPWYSMDKLVFNFVKKGTSGQGFTVCIPTLKFGGACFDDWAYDILHDRRLEATIKAELNAGEKYPKAYKFITGNDGSKTLGICASSNGNGYCINASVVIDGKKEFANIPVSFHDLRKLSENYIRSYTVRRNELEKLRYNSEINQASYRKNIDADDEQITEVEDIDTNGISIPVIDDSINETESVTTLKIKAKKEISERQSAPGNYSMQGYDEANVLRNIIFDKDAVNSLGTTWSKLLERSQSLETPLEYTANFRVSTENGREVLYFKSFAA